MGNANLYFVGTPVVIIRPFWKFNMAADSGGKQGFTICNMGHVSLWFENCSSDWILILETLSRVLNQYPVQINTESQSPHFQFETLVLQIYLDCDCVSYVNETAESMQHTAQKRECARHCSNLWLFTGVFSIIFFFNCIWSNPTFMLYLRYVLIIVYRGVYGKMWRTSVVSGSNPRQSKLPVRCTVVNIFTI